MRYASKTSILIALFLLGTALFNYPLLSLFNHPATLFGVPVLYLYMFGAWAVLIAMLIYTFEHH
ncbi:hypothetical protein BURK2_02387 [Burkholderiales bacterium]|nr:MAG: hypothetical protein F9K47_10140 [Burkholderiales bacterium]CAG0991024.1 hypothetical protein BURK2_02387 [Burkholderiales bacterium]